MNRTRPFQWGISSSNYRDETESGDKCLFLEFDGGVLIVVIDALGHGSPAAAVALLAANTWQQNRRENLATQMQRCHADLRATRGAAISVAMVNWNTKTLTWMGVGNVAGVIIRRAEGGEPQSTSLLVHSGLVGYRLPDLQPSEFDLTDITTLVMATDGIKRDFTDALPCTLEPQRCAQRILDVYAKRDDDATVLVFRYNGDL